MVATRLNINMEDLRQRKAEELVSNGAYTFDPTEDTIEIFCDDFDPSVVSSTNKICTCAASNYGITCICMMVANMVNPQATTVLELHIQTDGENDESTQVNIKLPTPIETDIPDPVDTEMSDKIDKRFEYLIYLYKAHKPLTKNLPFIEKQLNDLTELINSEVCDKIPHKRKIVPLHPYRKQYDDHVYSVKKKKQEEHVETSSFE